MEAAAGTVVTIHYTLRNSAGEVLDSSEGHDPLAYLHGRGNIVDGLEKALEGKSAGDKFNITLSPDEAYGSRDEAQVQTLPADEFAGVDEIEPGMQFNVHDDDGHHVITVTHVDGDQITVDGNHPLAGETLVFDVEVVGIREPTAEELSHGHVHGDGGHHH